MMKVELVFPPQWVPANPYLSVPSLTGFLKESGYNVIQKDVNIESYDALLSKSMLRGCYDKISEKIRQYEDKETLNKEQKHYFSKLRFYANLADVVLDNIENAKKKIRSEFFEGYQNLIYLRMALEMISCVYYPTVLGFSTYTMRYSYFSADDIFNGIWDNRENPFLGIFKDEIIPDLLRCDPKLLGISIIGMSQVIPGLTIAGLIKKEAPNIHINLGGNIFSRFAQEPWRYKDLFRIVDSITVFEGECALLELAEEIERGDDLRRVHNLVYQDENDEIRVNETTFIEDLNALPPPSFDDLNLDLYLSPARILPLLSSRGCYWGKCTFCTIPYGYGAPYRARNISLVVEDLKLLSERYKTKYFEFVDECVHPRRMEELSKKIIQEQLEIRWMAEAKLEKQFTKELCQKMHEAGCRILYFGLESANPRVLNLMCKGITIDDMRQTLRNSSEAGIWNHVFLFFGFPTETEEEANETIEFVLKNKDKIKSVAHSTFNLKKNSKVFVNKEKYSIQRIKVREQDFDLDFDYDVSTGINQKEAARIAEEFRRIVNENFVALSADNRWFAPFAAGYLD
ncbi:MAG: B12-binding domain-containing radical SAM protein [Candidatus Hodarchaeota archaeon]